MSFARRLSLHRVGTRGRIVLVAFAAALPTIVFAAYLLLERETVHRDVLAYGAAAVISVVLVVLVAWMGAERLVLAPIRTMLETSRRVSAGDLGARTGIAAGNEELSQLGAQLDAMAERLEARDRDLQRALADLQHQALTDPLTGLYNRRFFWDALLRQSAESRRTRSTFCVILLDIDYFKRVNDTWGHEAGDRVLRAIGRAVGEAIRESDVAARYGGEEFAILMPDSSLIVAAERADALRNRIGALRTESNGASIGVTVSLGVAEWSATLDDLGELMNTVDSAMYQAKARGRNRVVTAATGRFHDFPERESAIDPVHRSGAAEASARSAGNAKQ